MNKTSFYQFFNHDSKQANASRLPKNRFLAYFDIVKHRFGSLVFSSFLTSLFFLPLFVFLFLSELYNNLPQSGSYDEFTLAFRLFSLKTIEAIISVPLFVLGFVGLGGLFYVIKRLVHQEADIRSSKDFLIGLRANFKESIFAGLLFALYMIIFTANLYFFPTIEGFPVYISIIFVTVLSLFFVILFALVMFILTGASLYQFHPKYTLKNSALLAVILFPKNLLFILIGAVTLLGILFIPYVLIQLSLMVVTIVYGFSHMGLVFTLYSFKIYDQYINKQYEPGIVDQGLDKEE